MDIVKLQELSDSRGFTKINQTIEDKRCETDLMYALFKRPETVAPKLLSGLRDLILKKHEPDLAQSNKFNDALTFLLENPRAQSCAKVFMILLIINREEEAREVIRATYRTKSMAYMWGKLDNVTHFDTFLIHLKNIVDNTLRFPYGESNIDYIMHTFVTCAEQTYLTK